MEDKPVTTPKQPGVLAWFGRRKTSTNLLMLLGALIFIAFLFSERPFFTGLFIGIRRFGPITGLAALVLFAIYKLIAMKSRIAGGIVVVILVVLPIVLSFVSKVKPWELYGFISEYARYQTIEKIEIVSLPETGHEVMQPKISVHTIGEQELQQSEQISSGHLIRIDTQYRWTMAKEPIPQLKYARSRLSDGIKAVYSIPAERSSLDFADNRDSVDFAIGETLLLGEEANIAVMRALPFLDLFNTETGEARFMKNDKGEWVEVIPLIKWQGAGLWGFFFPQPEFGGVHVITQKEGHVPYLFVTAAFWQRAFFGAGTTYTPDEIEKIPYLTNQNLMPHDVKESIAKSFRFQNGILGPVNFSHEGDTRIPEIDGGIGSLPVTAYFKMSGVAKGSADKLYDYYGLEPYDTTKHGLVVSVFIPSDGRMAVYVHNHANDRRSLVGISTVPGKARESVKQYDWKESKVADIRPYFHKVNGQECYFWLFSIVTKAQSSHGYVSSPNSPVGLVDPIHQTVVWLAPEAPQKWIAQLDSISR